ncbi:MAG TPA: ScpA family protein, partial [Acidimicrobiia bacterium]|nr:ScpA family protein [Acidimicrobiia bacterium]
AGICAVREAKFVVAPLLDLITKEEVDIYEVALARIVDAYLAELERMDGLDLEMATEFLLIAATLVELKARRLLPIHGDVEIDEELLFEERDLLLARLLECKTFKDAAAAIERLRERARLSVPRTAGPEEPFASMAPDPLDRVTLEQFVAAAGRAFTPRPVPEVSLHHVTPIRVTVREAIDRVLDRLPERGSLTFRRLTAGARERIDVVVTFLAVLELYKRGIVEIDQPTVFGDLVVSRAEADGPLDLGGLDEWDEAVLDDEDEGADEDDAVLAGEFDDDPRNDAPDEFAAPVPASTEAGEG